jgi:hypothetical protein
VLISFKLSAAGFCAWKKSTASMAGAFAVEDAGPLMTVGAFGSVLNVSSAPLLVPPAFVAEILKW